MPLNDISKKMVEFQGKEIKKILIRSVNWIGDAILTTPAISALRRNFPQTKISILAKPYVSEIFKGNPDIDEIILYEGTNFAQRLKIIKNLREGKFDLAVLFQNAFEAALIAFLSGVPRRLGYSTDGRGLLLRPSVPLKAEILIKHHLEYYLDLLREVGLKVEKGPLILNLDEKERLWAIDFLKKRGWKEGERLIGINPGATYGSAKRWYPERFASLGDKLIEEGLKVIIFRGPWENAIVEEIKEHSRFTVHDSRLIADGKISIRELASLIEKCSVLVSNDTGPMHMASALRVPVVALFGSTDPIATGPVGEGHRVIQKKVDCSPCFLRECPRDFRCMDLIKVEEVLDAVKETLRAGSQVGELVR